MNIFKTFEIFLREPLSIFSNRVIQIVNINSNLITQASIDVDLLEKKAQITVVNSNKMYNLLKTVQYKRQLQAVQSLERELDKKEIVIGQLLGRK